uniref:Uncharacterized protein n=1 Tax=Setaria italica TaxID=4555 RepID=K4A3N6_SETIT
MNQICTASVIFTLSYFWIGSEGESQTMISAHAALQNSG